ncbi:Gamma-aminobutyric acid receptor subunit beta [Orchesella cincta]|uniref:Gamma-aminobutyric acid receptor subunit beta n=1 Tax=Orchesella cincta TaxID=48709 RepID=A0A1D2MHP0_ORCCI|nr:Gamma-aminobutyric acid receptor subunit beta [Orchesella cincta]
MTNEYVRIMEVSQLSDRIEHFFLLYFPGTPVAVNVSMHVLSISEIDVSKMTFTISFFVRQMWVDPRLSFNSRRNIDTITLDASTSERLPLWIPDTFFVNELMAVNHEILVRNQFCRISQDGSVLLSRRVTLTAFSPMSPNLFPYDSHKLRLQVESYGSQTKDMTYHWAPEKISISEHLTAPGFFRFFRNNKHRSEMEQ